MAPFYGWGSTASRLQPLRGGSLLFSIQFPEIPNKNITTNIFRIQAYESIMCGYFFIGFIDFMLKGKTEYTNLFSPNNFKKNDDIILNYFMSNI